MTRVVHGMKLGLVSVSPDWQPRATLDTEHVREMVEALEAGGTLPPLDVVELADGFALVDGYHRHGAHLAHETPTVSLRIVAKGDRDTARWWSLAANRHHGLKRTNVEKRRSVRDALGHVYGADMSNDDLAAHCGVSLSLIADVRREMTAPGPKAEATMRAEKVAASNPRASVRQVARAAGVSKDAAARALSRAGQGVSASKEKHETDTPPHAHREEVSAQGPTLAVRGATHAEIARDIEAVARRADVLGGGIVAEGLMQEVGALLRQARSAMQLGAPVACPAHVPDCSACGDRGWVTQATANQIARSAA